MEWQTVKLKLKRLFHLRSFDLILRAREAIFSSLTDGIIVLDMQGRVIEMNPSAQVMMDQNLDEVLGKSIEQAFRQANLLEDWTASRGEYAEFVTGTGANQQTYKMHVQSLSDKENPTAGRLILLHDITEQRILTEQLEDHTKEMQELAIVDELTGVANRRQLYNLGERELLRARRFGHPFSAITFDIDHFKRINDIHGRHVGDQVLRTLAPIVQNNIRDTDLLARSGGEEFVITLPETNLSAACEIAERIRKTVAETPILITRETIRVTISLGVAQSTAETRQLEDLLSAADNAMVKAKQAGRNRIFYADHSLARHFYFDFLPA